MPHYLAQRPALLPVNGLRTFQRRVTRWRTQYGPPKEVFFPQVRVPGASVQVDWTHAHKLGVTLAGRISTHREHGRNLNG